MEKIKFFGLAVILLAGCNQSYKEPKESKVDIKDSLSQEDKKLSRIDIEELKQKQWFAFPGSFMSQAKCVETDEYSSPSYLIKGFELLKKNYAIKENQKIEDVVMDMSITADDGEMRFIRGEDLCQRQLDKNNVVKEKSNQAESNRIEEKANKYK